MKKYDTYKDSGIEWIGEIPENWDCSALKYLLRSKITDGPHETPEFLSEGVPFLSVDSIQNGELIFDNCRKISVENYESFKKKCKIEEGDILMGKAASVGKIAQVKVNFDFTIWSPLALIKPKREKIHSSFLEYFLKSSYAQYNINIFSTYNTQQNISMQDIPRISVSFPSKNEQSHIISYLDRKTKEIDLLITQNEKLIDLFEEEKQSIIIRIITKGLNAGVQLKDSEIDWLGDIPEHWDIKRLRYLGVCQNGISQNADYFGSGFPFINYGDVYKNFVLPETASGLANSTDSDQETYSVQEGDVFFTRTSETIEEIGLTSTCLKTIEKAVFSGFLIRFRPTTDRLISRFSKYYFRAHVHRKFFVKEMNLVTRASLSQELLKKLPVLLPPKEEQIEIADYLDQYISNVDSKIEKTIRLIELLKEYRTALISEVVTGKIKVVE